MSNARKGSYYKARSKKWLIDHGWLVWDMEVMHWIYPPGREPFPVKHDQLASDLGAMKGDRIAFIQVKGGEAASGGTFPAARRAFAAFQFPSFVEQWVMAWAPRAREPRIVEVQGDRYVEKARQSDERQRQEEDLRLTLEDEDAEIPSATRHGAGS